MERKNGNHYSLKQYLLIFAGMMAVILIICMIPRFTKSKTEGTEGEIVLREDTGLEDDPLELTDGPTGGDGQDMYKETYTNGKELMEDGLYLGASYLLLTSFEQFKRENEGYSAVTTLTYISGTFEENESQQTFEVMLNDNPNNTLKAVYSISEKKLTYIKQ